MLPGAPENKRANHFEVEDKMGFKPIIRCSCGASIDTGKAKRRELYAFRIAHEECKPEEWEPNGTD